MAHENEGKELVITRTLSAPTDFVWSVWFRREHAIRWWGPKNFTVPVFAADFRGGGKWRAVVASPEGNEYPQYGEFLEIEPPHRMVFTLTWLHEKVEQGMTCSCTFVDKGSKTEMTFRKGPFQTPESYESEMEGWNECFDRLASYVADWRIGVEGVDKAEAISA